MSDLDINAVNFSPADVKSGASFSITVDVEAEQEDFDEGAAYNVVVFVNGLQAGLLGGPPATSITKGNLQDTNWPARITNINFSLTAGPSPDVYTITVVTLGGPHGTTFQAIKSAGPLVVHA